MVVIETAAKDLFAPIADLRAGDALEDWRWLIGKGCDALLLTAMGDVFVHRPARLFRREAVYFLDTMIGAYKRVASSHAELRELLQSEDHADRWLLPSLVEELRSRGVVLQPGQCYSPKHPPILGGSLPTVAGSRAEKESLSL
jgi:hypothetical protein